MKQVYILGIHGSHHASAVLLKNGEIVAGALEERFTRKKNQAGYPRHAIAYCLSQAGIRSHEVAGIYVGQKEPFVSFFKESYFQKNSLTRILANIKPFVTETVKHLRGKAPLIYKLYEMGKKVLFTTYIGAKQKSFLAKELAIDRKRIHTIDHHTAHAYAAYYSNKAYKDIAEKKALVLTVDEQGDGVSSKIFTVKDTVWIEIAKTSSTYSLGGLFDDVTQYLGMDRNQDQSKVMGLAPYARGGEKIYTLLQHLLWVDGLHLQSSVTAASYYTFLQKHLGEARFDHIAAAIQKLTEDILVKLAQNAMQKTKTKILIVGGGIFMNIKANLRLTKISQLHHLYVMPSSTDDSLAIGAAYFGYKDYCEKAKISFAPKGLSNLYLGPSFSKRQVGKEVRKFSAKHRGILVKEMIHPEKEIAKLLAQGAIVARFAGRMEYGARALGNRSILANPSDYAVVRILNEQIKRRDFWMPFAPVILAEKAKDYLINPKQVDSPFMTLAFETTQKARKDLVATLHQYDFTTRAQVLSYEQNPKLYALIKDFERRTGLGAVLNTSFNLHREPIVCTPKDALYTFWRSHLKFLAIEDYLLEKLF